MTNTMQYLKRLCEAPNRRQEVKDILTELGVPFKAIKSPEGGRNYVVHFGRPWVNVYGAHHDRVRPGIPAANDNGASVAILLDLVEEMHATGFPGDLTVLLLDYEEGLAYGKPGIVGSKHIAKYLMKRHIQPKSFCILELCGIGDTLMYRNGHSKCEGPMARFIVYASKHNMGHPMKCAPLTDTIPSDDAVLQWGGLDSFLITMLPAAEVEHYSPTWNRMHTVRDNFESIQPKTVKAVRDLIYNFVTLVRLEK